mgnify:CR=1 FL=1
MQQLFGGAKREVKTLEEIKSPAYSGCWNNIFLSIFYWQHGNYHATIFSATLSISISSISSNCFFPVFCLRIIFFCSTFATNILHWRNEAFLKYVEKKLRIKILKNIVYVKYHFMWCSW